MHTNDLEPRELKALLFIRDSILYRHKAPSYRVLAEHIGFKSPRSSYLLVEQLIDKGFLERTAKGNLRLLQDIQGNESGGRTVDIPVVGSVACGLPLLAEENVEAMIPVSQQIARPGAQYFLLRAAGNSMNSAGIEDGDLVLVRQQPVAENGQRVVALIDDSATIKELQHHKDKVVLVPRSSDPSHQPIILERDFLIQGVVIDTLPNPMEKTYA